MDLLSLEKNIPSASLIGKVFLIYGPPKTGKTTVASQFPNALILGFEKGYQFLDNAYCININLWSDFTAVLRELKKPAVKEKYKTIVIDTVAIAYQMCYDMVLRSFDVEDPGEVGYGKAWTAIKDNWKDSLDSIVALGYGLVIIAHADEREEEVTDKITKKKSTKVTIKPDIPRLIRGYLEGLADFILYVHKDPKPADGWNVYAYSDLPNTQCGSRAKYLPKSFLFTIESLQESMKTAIDMQAKSLNITTAELAAEQVIQNPHAVEIDFDALKAEVIKYITVLNGTAAVTEVVAYITKNFDVKISQTTKPLHQDKLLAAREFLLNLADQLGIDLNGGK